MIVESHHGGDIDNRYAELFLGRVAVRIHGRRKLVEVATLSHDSDNADGQRIDTIEHVDGQRVSLLRGVRRIAKRLAQIRVATVGEKHEIQLLANLKHTLCPTLFKGGVEEHAGIGRDLFFCEQSIIWH